MVNLGTVVYVVISVLIGRFFANQMETKEEQRLAFVVVLVVAAIAYFGGREGGACEECWFR